MTQTIESIKVNNNKTVITFSEETVEDIGTNKVTEIYTSDEIRHIDFDKAAEACVPWLRGIFKLPKDWEVSLKNVDFDREDNFKASFGIYIKFGDDFNKGANLPLPQIILTPENGKNKLPIQLKDALEVLMTEARNFAFENKRAQGQLFNEEEGEQEEENNNTIVRTKKRAV